MTSRRWFGLNAGASNWLWLGVAVIALDQWTKWLVVQRFDEFERLVLLPVLEFMRLHNEGAAFSFLDDAGGWLMGGRRGTLAVYGTDGIREMVHCPDQETVFQHANGRFDDLLVAVAEGRSKPPTLWAMAAHRWLKPLPLDGVAYVATLLRLDEDRWIISGRLTQGHGFAAIYTPMQWEVTYLLTPPTRAFAPRDRGARDRGSR